MFFHIDESGNTGNNLFDTRQPVLSYGLLSSHLNVDALGVSMHRRILRKLGINAIHANELGIDGLMQVAPDLMTLYKRFRFDFDYYFIDKPAYALVMLFDAIFDAGLNEAVPWQWYWTPMRFVAIFKLSALCDEDMLRLSWDLRTTSRIEDRLDEVVGLLRELERRTLDSRLDDRTTEVFLDSFRFGQLNPETMDFGTDDARRLSPNAVAFQFVVTAIARRYRNSKSRLEPIIKVDRQQQYNPAQITTHYYYEKISASLAKASEEERRFRTEHPLHFGIDPEDTLLKDLPKRPPVVARTTESIGLQIADVYLWLLNRQRRHGDLPGTLISVLRKLFGRMQFDGISMDGMRQRWESFEAELPVDNDLTVADREAHKSRVEEHRAKVSDLFNRER